MLSSVAAVRARWAAVLTGLLLACLLAAGSGAPGDGNEPPRLGARGPALPEGKADLDSPASGRERTTGSIRAGDVIATYGHGACSAGFGAWESGRSRSGRPVTRYFLLTAAHCASFGETVARRSNPRARTLEKVGRTERTGFDAEPSSFDTDAAAVRIDDPGIAPRRIYAAPEPPIDVEGAVVPRRGMRVCQSGRASNTVDCGRIVTGVVRVEYLGQKTLQFCYRGALARFGDSGGPVWKQGTHLAVGLITAGTEDPEGNPLDEGCLTPLLPIPGRPHVSAAFGARGLGALHLLIRH